MNALLRMTAISSATVALVAGGLKAQARGYVIPAPKGQPRVAGIAPAPPPQAQPYGSGFSQPGQTVFSHIPAFVTPDGRVFVNYGYGYEEVAPVCPNYGYGCQGYSVSSPGYGVAEYVPPSYSPPAYAPPAYAPPAYSSPGYSYPSAGYTQAPAGDVGYGRMRSGNAAPVQPTRVPASAAAPQARPPQMSAAPSGARAQAPGARVLVHQPHH